MIKQFLPFIFFLIVTFLLNSCATYNTQISKDDQHWESEIEEKENPIYSVYLIGDAGKLDEEGRNIVNEVVAEKLKSETKQSSIIFLGDNIYPNGMPKKGKKGREKSEKILDAQIATVKNYKGKTIFIPGNHDWRKGVKGVNRQAKYIEKQLDNKKGFYPEKGCPLQKIKINDDVVIIAIDSEWYLKDWDKEPNINDNCSIKTRLNFLDEFESLIKKSNGKTTIIAIHHPIYSNGSHGGQYSLKQQMIPVPIAGSIASLLRKTGGVSSQDLQSKRYVELRTKLIAIAQNNPKAVFVSGHEHNLQYIVKNNLPQIISGSGSKNSPTRNIECAFTYNQLGFAKLNIYKDGSSDVQFYGIENNKEKLVYQTEVFPSYKKMESVNYNNTTPEFLESSIYTNEETSKSKFCKSMWGQRYRDYYSQKVKVPTVNLDTLFGGLTPKRKGGGHQSVSLILTNTEGKEYVMRAMHKSATKYLQTVAFKNQYIDNELNDTFSEDLILDVFTGSYPYAPYTIASLSDAIEVYHPNPVLYYVSKQNALKGYNNEYGNELYMIEERVTSGHGDIASFGFSNTIISTDDMLKKLRKNHKYSVDQSAFIRARLFDMVIGDWDRHEDQWRWAEFKGEGKKIIYKPIPRDRDQAFSIMGDGFLMGILTSITPSLHMLKSYDDELKDPKGFNFEPYPLDMALINGAKKSLWDAQVAYIQANLTEEVIVDAFKNFPPELIGETILEIKQKLLSRISKLQKISDSYYSEIQKYSIVKGTDKRDWFEIKRLPNGKTQVIGYKDINRELEFYNSTFNHEITKELLIFGLDDDDYFEVYGEGNKLIHITIVGGQNNDSYNIINGKKVKIRDYKSKKNTFVTNNGRKSLTDDYNVNVYNHKNAKYNINQIIPNIGFNKDDGMKIGAKNIYTNNGFHKDHFSQKQTIEAYYFTSTNGFEFIYKGEFNKLVGNFKLNVDAVFTSPNYSINFFGFGNETENLDDELGDDYNRVKLKTFAFSPSLVREGINGSSIKAALNYEIIETDKTEGRYISDSNDLGEVPNTVFDDQNYLGADVIYKFENVDNKSFPTLGLKTSLQIGVKSNIDNENTFGYVIPEFGFDYKLIPSGKLVFATKIKAHINIGDGYEFYDAPSIGASDGLRGYRNQRFTGKTSFYQNIDLRYKFNKIKTGVLPINLGVFGGFDYGRVWVKNDPSNQWHTSYGGGVIFSIYDLMSAKFGVFSSKEDTLFSFGLGVGF